MRGYVAACGWVFALVVSGCAERVVPLALDELDAAWVRATCEHWLDCDAVPSLDRCPFTESPYVGSVELARTGELQYDGVVGRRCVDAIVARGCDARSNDPRNTSACVGLFRGMRALGESCGTGEGICEDGTCNFQPTWPPYPGCPPPPPGPGVCGPLRGCDACDPAREYCESVSSTTGTCHPLIREGEPCPDFRSCDLGLACAADPANPPNTKCVPMAQRGESCAGGRTCGGLGDLCNYVTDICEMPRVVGDPCTNSIECYGGLCDTATGLCADWPEPGNACIESCGGTPPTCQYLCHGYCDANHLCKPASLPDGSACEAAQECQSGNCVDGMCRSSCPF